MQAFNYLLGQPSTNESEKYSPGMAPSGPVTWNGFCCSITGPAFLSRLADPFSQTFSACPCLRNECRVMEIRRTRGRSDLTPSPFLMVLFPPVFPLYFFAPFVPYGVIIPPVRRSRISDKSSPFLFFSLLGASSARIHFSHPLASPRIGHYTQIKGLKIKPSCRHDGCTDYRNVRYRPYVPERFDFGRRGAAGKGGRGK